MLTLHLPEDIETRLELLSLRTGRSAQYYAREAILEYLDDVEARYLALDRSDNGGTMDFGNQPEIY